MGGRRAPDHRRPSCASPEIAYGALAVLVGLVFLWWAPTPATRKPATAMVLMRAAGARPGGAAPADGAGVPGGRRRRLGSARDAGTIVSERLRWLGHATVALEIGGATLLTDPVVRNRIAHLRRRAAPAVPPPRARCGAHLPHAPRPSGPAVAARAGSVRAADRAARRRPCGAQARPRGGGAERRATRSRSAALACWRSRRRTTAGAGRGARPPRRSATWWRARRACTSRATRRSSRDGRPRPDRLRAAADLGLGLTLGPGQWTRARRRRPRRCVAPAVAVPIHWGTFLPVTARARHKPLLVMPPQRYAELAAELAPETEVRILPPGGEMALDPEVRQKADDSAQARAYSAPVVLAPPPPRLRPSRWPASVLFPAVITAFALCEAVVLPIEDGAGRPLVVLLALAIGGVFFAQHRLPVLGPRRRLRPLRGAAGARPLARRLLRLRGSCSAASSAPSPTAGPAPGAGSRCSRC